MPQPPFYTTRELLHAYMDALKKLLSYEKLFPVITICILLIYSGLSARDKKDNSAAVLRISLLHFPDSAFIDELAIRHDTNDDMKPVSMKLPREHGTTFIATKQGDDLMSIITHRRKKTNDTIPIIVKSDKKDIFFIRLQGHSSIKRHVYIKDDNTTPTLHELSANTHFVCHYNPTDILHAEKRYILILSDTLIIKRWNKSSGKLEPGTLYSVHYDRKNDQIHVKIGIGKFHVTISDQMGNRVFDGPVVSKNGLVKIGTSEIKNGLYQVKMVDVFGNYETGKFIKY